MRKLILVLAAIVICFGAEAKSPLKWGVKAGLNYHTVGELTTLGRDIVKATDRVGWHAGLQASWQVSRMFSIDPELIYSRNSYNLTTEMGGGGIAYLNTVDIPVALGVNVIGPLKIQAGININVLTDSGAKDDQKAFRFNLTPQVLGYLLGVGADFGRFNVSLRYNGFFEKNEGSASFNILMQNDGAVAQAEDPLMRMRVSTWQLGVGFYF
jgi:hypothetical protein